MADYGGQQVASPYHAMNCNPVVIIDPIGLEGDPFTRGMSNMQVAPIWTRIPGQVDYLKKWADQHRAYMESVWAAMRKKNEEQKAADARTQAQVNFVTLQVLLGPNPPTTVIDLITRVNSVVNEINYICSDCWMMGELKEVNTTAGRLPKPVREGQQKGAAIVANVQHAVFGKGHSGLLVQRSDGTWQFISKEGRREDGGGSSNNASSGGAALRAVDLNYKTLDDFFADQRHKRYNRFAMVSVADVGLVETTMRQNANSTYHLICANCGTAVNNALEAGGISTGSFITPNSQFWAITSRNIIYWYYER